MTELTIPNDIIDQSNIPDNNVGSQGNPKAKIELPKGASAREVLENLANRETMKPKETSITGRELPSDWPHIISPDEEAKGYDALYDSGEDRSQPPTHQHIDRLSYTLTNGSKELRYLAVQHINGQENRTHPQFTAIKENFDRQKPQIVFYEGPQGNPESISEENAYRLGESAYIQYLVLEHNKNLQPGEEPIVMQSCDLQPRDEPEEYRKSGYTNEEIAASEVLKWMYFEVNSIKNTPGMSDEQKAQKIAEIQNKYDQNPIGPIPQEYFSLVPRSDGQEWNAELIKAEIQKQTGQPLKVDLNYLELPRFKQMYEDQRVFRDQHVVRTIVNAAKKYDRVMTVMGSGHAIRDKQALEQFYEAKAA